MKFHRSRPQTGGFTLVELLVVIAIVSILAALLLPGLARAKAKSQSIYCVNSLKQIALSASFYVADNSAKYPWTFTLEGDQLERQTWYTYLQPYQPSRRLWLCPVRPKTIALAPIRPAGLLQRSDEGEIIYPSDGTVVNYAANFELGGCRYTGMYEYQSLNEDAVLRPSGLVYITDSGSQAANTPDPQLCVTPQSAPKHGGWILADPSSTKADAAKVATDDPNWCGPQLRHSDAANVLFVDGHVEKELRASKWYYPGTPALKPNDGTNTGH